MSDTFVLCPKCGEELEIVQIHHINLDIFAKDNYEQGYYCNNCHMHIAKNDIKIVTTEYFNDKGEEDEQGNQSRRSKE